LTAFSDGKWLIAAVRQRRGSSFTTRIVSETLLGSASKTCAASLTKAAAEDESKSSNLSKLKLLRPMRNSPRRPA
jgi:hypothetical protein